MLKKYFNEIFDTAKSGDVREESYYPALKNLLEASALRLKTGHQITQLPKKTQGSNPDFRITTAKRELVGYIEVKDPKTNLDLTEDSEQLNRYRSTFTNLILTNLFEFRLWDCR